MIEVKNNKRKNKKWKIRNWNDEQEIFKKWKLKERTANERTKLKWRTRNGKIWNKGREMKAIN